MNQTCFVSSVLEFKTLFIVSDMQRFIPIEYTVRMSIGFAISPSILFFRNHGRQLKLTRCHIDSPAGLQHSTPSSFKDVRTGLTPFHEACSAFTRH